MQNSVSENRLTHEELNALVEPYLGYVGRVFRHTKSGNVYRITGISLREEDLVPLVTYRACTLTRQPHFTRTAENFFDGRFEFA